MADIKKKTQSLKNTTYRNVPVEQPRACYLLQCLLCLVMS